MYQHNYIQGRISIYKIWIYTIKKFEFIRVNFKFIQLGLIIQILDVDSSSLDKTFVASDNYLNKTIAMIKCPTYLRT